MRGSYGQSIWQGSKTIGNGVVGGGRAGGSNGGAGDLDGAAACALSGNELGYMYYFDLDGVGNNTGTQTFGGATLDDIQPDYWSGTEFNSNFAWKFLFGNGDQRFDVKDFQLSAWAVRPGDVAAAPEPASLLLIGAGMLGLGWTRRRGRRR